MFCWIFKWKISQSHDLNIPLSGMTAGHVSRCSQCRDFDRSLHALTDRLQRSVPGFLLDRKHDLAEKAMTGLARKPVKTRSLILRNRPVFAAAASLVIIVAGLLVLFRLDFVKESPPDDSFPLKPAAALSTPAVLKGIVTIIESTFDQELKRLEQHLNSATRSLADGLKLD
jgi:hypothetical protein